MPELVRTSLLKPSPEVLSTTVDSASLSCAWNRISHQGEYQTCHREGLILDTTRFLESVDLFWHTKRFSGSDWSLDTKRTMGGRFLSTKCFLWEWLNSEFQTYMCQ